MTDQRADHVEHALRDMGQAIHATLEAFQQRASTNDSNNRETREQLRAIDVLLRGSLEQGTQGLIGRMGQSERSAAANSTRLDAVETALKAITEKDSTMNWRIITAMGVVIGAMASAIATMAWSMISK